MVYDIYFVSNSLLWDGGYAMATRNTVTICFCFVSDSEERPIVIQGKEIVCLLFHQPSLFETVI